MQTRRELLKRSVVLPFAAAMKPGRITAAPGGVEIRSEGHCLSEESAAGYRSIRSLTAAARGVVVLCGASDVRYEAACELRTRARSGDWILWEAFGGKHFDEQRLVLRDVFGIAAGEPMDLCENRMRAAGMYVAYSWPHAVMTRAFGPLIPVTSCGSEAIAHYGGLPVAMRRRIGQGGIVFLGSILGVNLRAEEPEARALAERMIWTVASGRVRS